MMKKLHEQAAKDYAEIRFMEGQQSGIGKGVNHAELEALKERLPAEQVSRFTALTIEQLSKLLQDSQ